ncbi:MAG: hypothetical protein IJN71_06525 [Oscillospiraceae bacterium]|nr:hypothetical protein [Oscillospiraceae bacterium]
MNLAYLILVVLWLSSFSILIYSFFQLKKRLTYQKVEGTIIDVLDSSWTGVLQYTYRFYTVGKEHILSGPKQECFNPFLLANPQMAIGKIKTIYFCEERNEISMSIPAILVRIVLGLFILSICVLISILANI